jgi:hypothetical protein
MSPLLRNTGFRALLLSAFFAVGLISPRAFGLDQNQLANILEGPNENDSEKVEAIQKFVKGPTITADEETFLFRQLPGKSVRVTQALTDALLKCPLVKNEADFLPVIEEKLLDQATSEFDTAIYAKVMWVILSRLARNHIGYLDTIASTLKGLQGLRETTQDTESIDEASKYLLGAAHSYRLPRRKDMPPIDPEGKQLRRGQPEFETYSRTFTSLASSRSRDIKFVSAIALLTLAQGTSNGISVAKTEILMRDNQPSKLPGLPNPPALQQGSVSINLLEPLTPEISKPVAAAVSSASAPEDRKVSGAIPPTGAIAVKPPSSLGIRKRNNSPQMKQVVVRPPIEVRVSFSEIVTSVAMAPRADMAEILLNVHLLEKVAQTRPLTLEELGRIGEALRLPGNGPVATEVRRQASFIFLRSTDSLKTIALFQPGTEGIREALTAGRTSLDPAIKVIFSQLSDVANQRKNRETVVEEFERACEQESDPANRSVLLADLAKTQDAVRWVAALRLLRLVKHAPLTTGESVEVMQLLERTQPTDLEASALRFVLAELILASTANIQTLQILDPESDTVIRVVDSQSKVTPPNSISRSIAALRNIGQEGFAPDELLRELRSNCAVELSLESEKEQP